MMLTLKSEKREKLEICLSSISILLSNEIHFYSLETADKVALGQRSKVGPVHIAVSISLLTVKNKFI